MSQQGAFLEVAAAHWPVWVVTATLLVAAVIDGWKLKVPNWLTYPMILAGWAYSALWGEPNGWEGLGYSLVGTVVGLALLMPLYAVGGMGAGDVKLLAGVGAWVWTTATWHSFCLTAVIGGAMAVVMVLLQRKWAHHQSQFFAIAEEILTVRNPDKLSETAAARKPSMMLLPYGIPITIGCIVYFFWSGMMF